MKIEAKRKEVNALIGDILARNDESRQMRASLDSFKRKISEVLRLFKVELEAKMRRKYDDQVR